MAAAETSTQPRAVTFRWPVRRARIVVADSVAALVEAAAAHIARSPPPPSPRAGGSRRAGGRLDAARAVPAPGHRHRLDAHRRLLRRRARRAARRSAVELPDGAGDAARPGARPGGERFRWQAESPDLDAAARDYEQALRARGAPPWIDLALLGLGPDGHTASLFPGTSALAVEDRLAVAVEVPELATRRLTLTYPALLGARRRDVPGDRRGEAGGARRRPPPRQHPARRPHHSAAGPAVLRSCAARTRAPEYKWRPMTVLAGDIGGTNTRLAIFDVAGLRAARREADLRANLPVGGPFGRWM